MSADRWLRDALATIRPTSSTTRQKPRYSDGMAFLKTPEQRRQKRLDPHLSAAQDATSRGVNVLVIRAKEYPELPIGDLIDAIEKSGWSLDHFSATAAAPSDPKVVVMTPEHWVYLVFRR